jgi:diguanylate cyclase (GGDEF)-like protein
MNKHSWLTGLLPRKSPIGAELGQAKFRVLNVSSFCSYLVLAWHFRWHPVPASVAIGALGYIAYSVLWVFVVRFSIINAKLRRTLAAILDQALPALGMYLAGSLAGLVAWVPAIGSIGSGLRFGTRYTWLSSAVGGPLMGVAFFFSPDWHSIPGIAAGIVLANVLLPLYVVVLVKRIEHDKRTLELRAAHFEAATKHDSLTGLLNRAGFADVFKELLVFDTEQREMSAVFLLDLDGFKAINDACGHAAGDDVLKAVASSLTGCLRISDTVARLGGDEFGILIRHIKNDKNAECIAEKMLNAITQVGIPRRDLRLGASIGICVLPHPDLRTYEDILKAADQLMYEAKAAGKNRFRTLRNDQALDPIIE